MNNVRLLTDEQTNQIRNFYKTGFPIGVIFILAFGIPISIVVLAFAGIIIMATLLILLAAGIYLIMNGRSKKIARALEVYQYGIEKDISFDSIEDNYSYRINGKPQQIINIRQGNELIQVKTFSNKVCNAFSVPLQKAYFYDKYPDIILPSSIFSAKDEQNPYPQKTRSINI